MIKIVKTTFEEEQKEKDDSFLRLSPIQRLDRMRQVRERMKKSEVKYSFGGMIVKVRKSL
jgi:hypothetical protein